MDGSSRAVDKDLDALKPPPDTPGLAETAKGTEKVDSDLLDDATQAEPEEPRGMTEEEKIEIVRKAQEMLPPQTSSPDCS